MGDLAALSATDDRRERARCLVHLHDRMASGSFDLRTEPAPKGLRPLVARSWQRCIAGGMAPGSGGAQIGAGPLTADDLARRRDGHPLSIAASVMARAFAGVADPHHLVFVSDADGTLLWLDGPDSSVARAREAGVVEGVAYSEARYGTSAVGTSLVEGTAVQIFAAEHFEVGFHPLGCSAAPVRDPFSGDIVGAVGVGGTFTGMHPHSLTLVRLAARAIEQQVLSDAQAVAARALHLPEATFAVVGRERGVVRTGARRVELSRRHTEILLLLCLVPEGLTAERMAAEMYGPGGRAGTVRTEMHRLRSALPELIGERPYRLLGRIDCDIDGVEHLVETGDVATAITRYPGVTLATTTVERLIERRDSIDDRIRGAVLASGNVALLERWLGTPAGRDDVRASRSLMASLARDDPRRAAERSRLRRLTAGDHD